MWAVYDIKDIIIYNNGEVDGKAVFKEFVVDMKSWVENQRSKPNYIVWPDRCGRPVLNVEDADYLSVAEIGDYTIPVFEAYNLDV